MNGDNESAVTGTCLHRNEGRRMSERPDRPRRIIRVLVPALLILGWLAGAAIGGPYFGRVDEVSSNDNATYLPQNAEATQVRDRLDGFLESDTIPAVVIITGEAPLTRSDLSAATAVMEDVSAIGGVDDGVSPPIPSQDGKAAQIFVPIDAEADIGDVVERIRAILTTDLPDTLTSHVTGPAGFTADLLAGFAGIDGLLLAVALSAVLVILLLVYRSLLLPVMVLATSMFALCVALLTVWWLAKADIVVLTGQTQGILFILVIGAATDYALLYTARYREELRRNRDRGAATRSAIRGAVEPILASGGTVIAGLLCLLLSDLGSNKSLGPVAAIGIGFAMLSALTLLPALLFALGRTAYWPRRPLYEPDRSSDAAAEAGAYARIGTWIEKRPRTVWIACTLLLVIGTALVTQLRADGVPQSEFVLTASDARDGQDALAEHFAAGSGTPLYLITSESDYRDVAKTVLSDDGIDSVAITAPSPSGTVRLDDAGEPVAPPGTTSPPPTVDDGDVLLQATLTDATDSDAAGDTVRRLRADLASTAIIGGTTAIDVDTNDTAEADRDLIIPVVLAVILVILMALLRSVLAPVLLIATTVLSFGTAMGVSALVFNDLFDFPGADPSVPLYGFVFLVALGIDYNIFLMTRVREEALRHGTRQGIHQGLAVTGGVITSAGIVLAATFAALAVIPILFLVQLAFIVAFGVLLDTFLVRTLLVPALGFDIGRRIWWPSRRFSA